MARKPVSVLPDGGDVVVRADEVRAGMWLLDPETGEWGSVKQAGVGNACVGFGGVRTWRVSLRKLGAREFGVDEQVTVRVPADMHARRTDDADVLDGEMPRRLLIHGITCDCRPGCEPGGVCRWVGCCRSPIESARVLPSEGMKAGSRAIETKGETHG